MFAAVCYDEAKGEFVISRDELGKASLYWGKGHDGAIWVASEMKAIQEKCKEFYWFPPGSYLKCNITGGVKGTHSEIKTSIGQWYNAPWINESLIPSQPADLKVIHDTFVNAVVKRLMTDVHFGVLLSGEWQGGEWNELYLVVQRMDERGRGTSPSARATDRQHTLPLDVCTIDALY